MEEKTTESSEEQPSTSLRRDLLVLRRKGKEMEKDETDEELMAQPQVTHIPPTAKRCRT